MKSSKNIRFDIKTWKKKGVFLCVWIHASAFSYLCIFLLHLLHFYFFFNRNCWLFFHQQCASVAILQSIACINGFCMLFMKFTNFTIFIKNRSYDIIYIFKNYFITVSVMLTSVLKALIKNPIKESFYGKKKQLIFW